MIHSSEVAAGKYGIVPVQGFPLERGRKFSEQAVAYWLATGFFLDRDSFWEDVQWQRPEVEGPLWFYEPRDISFDQAVEEFASLFEDLVKEQIGDKQALLPLSGGLDSRSLAVACHRLGIKPFTFSYRFTGSFQETKYGQAIAKVGGWPFQAFDIPPGYLWDKIEQAASINHCYSEFTHPRQMAVVEEVAGKGEIWLLGHGGDLFFDDMGVPDDLPYPEQLLFATKKIIKKGGAEFGTDYWQSRGLPGTFGEAIQARAKTLLDRIEIQNANARLRAYKSMYSVGRWTMPNLAFFYHFRPVSLPFFDDRMCRFICTVPEKHLAGRRIQIEYLKRYGPKFATIPWQDKEPYNLYNLHKHRTLAHLPWRIVNKAKEVINERVLGKGLVQRNWEIQFLGPKNSQHLEAWLFENEKLNQFVAPSVVEKYYKLFREGDSVFWSHPVSMLLTLSVFSKKFADTSKK